MGKYSISVSLSTPLAVTGPHGQLASTYISFILQLPLLPYFTDLHIQKAYTHTGTSFPQILLLSAHAYM